METFNITPQYVWESTSAFRVLKTEFENGTEQRKYLGTQPRQWGLSFKGEWSSHVSQVVSFYEARKGSFEAFYWTPPGEATAVTVRFNDDSLTAMRYGMTRLGECSVTLTEVF